MLLASGQFPKRLKTAKVIPMYKKNLKINHGNYRSVSILSILSKIIERKPIIITPGQKQSILLGSNKLLRIADKPSYCV